MNRAQPRQPTCGPGGVSWGSSEAGQEPLQARTPCFWCLIWLLTGASAGAGSRISSHHRAQELPKAQCSEYLGQPEHGSWWLHVPCSSRLTLNFSDLQRPCSPYLSALPRLLLPPWSSSLSSSASPVPAQLCTSTFQPSLWPNPGVTSSAKSLVPGCHAGSPPPTWPTLVTAQCSSVSDLLGYKKGLLRAETCFAHVCNLFGTSPVPGTQ